MKGGWSTLGGGAAEVDRAAEDARAAEDDWSTIGGGATEADWSAENG